MIISEEDFLDIPFKDISTHKIDDEQYLLISEYSSRSGIGVNPTLFFRVKTHYSSDLQDVWLWE